jgi:tRNA (mo5U34)-methyltransferase
MEPQELKDRIDAFPRWHYRFEFEGGIRTPVAYEGQANRHAERRRYFFEPLLELLGGSLAGRRVLDLGCNAGWWSLQALEAGADFVLGVDARADCIEQAELVFEAKALPRERFRFATANVFDGPGFAAAGEGPFDVALCLGMLDVTARPLELFELMAGLGAELIVLDTGISRMGPAAFEVSALSEPANVVDHQLTLLPSRRAVVELAQEFGYESVALAHELLDDNGLEDYRRGQRIAFICARKTGLGTLRPAPEQTMLPWWVSSLDLRGLLARLRG